jgi:predicted dehydrogenase
MGLRHVQVALNLGWSVAGICDANAEATRKAVEQFGLSAGQVFSSVDALLSEGGPEAVAVATTAPSHAKLVLQAAGAGVKYILCEKPMAVSIAECERMVSACRESGARLAVNHQMRFMEQYTSIKQQAQRPELGGLHSVAVLGSNFGLAMNGTHYFEMFRYLTDDDVVSVSAWLDEPNVPNPRGPQFLDNGGQIRCVNARGQTLFMDCSTFVGHGVQVAYLCRNGQIVVDELSGQVRIIHRQTEFLGLPTTRYAMPAVESLTKIAPADVIGPTESVWRAVVEGQVFPDGAAGLHAVSCAAAAHASHAAQGRAIGLASSEVDAERVFPWA